MAKNGLDGGPSAPREGLAVLRFLNFTFSLKMSGDGLWEEEVISLLSLRMHPSETPLFFRLDSFRRFPVVFHPNML